MLLATGLSFLLAATSFPGEPATPAKPEVELAIGYDVVARKVEPVPAGHVFQEGERVTTWTSVAGLSNGFIEHVWVRDGVEVARHYLPVGAGRRWRTWSRHKVKAGVYEVQVIGPDGASLGTVKFDVEVASGC